MCCSDVLALPIFKQEEPQLSPENEARLPPLQYVLCAATSPAVKLHEETLTYLNQGSGWSMGPGQSLRAGATSLKGWGIGPSDPFGLPYLVTLGLRPLCQTDGISQLRDHPEPPCIHLQSGRSSCDVAQASRGVHSFLCTPSVRQVLGDQRPLVRSLFTVTVADVLSWTWLEHARCPRSAVLSGAAAGRGGKGAGLHVCQAEAPCAAGSRTVRGALEKCTGLAVSVSAL